MTMEPNQSGQPEQPEPEAPAEADVQPPIAAEVAPSEAVTESATTPAPSQPEPIGRPRASRCGPSCAR